MAADAQSSQSDERLTSLSRSARFAAVDARQAITPITEPARPRLSVARMVMLTSVMTLARSLGVERAVIFHVDDVGMCHAQIERARSAGIRPTHIDAHMAAAMLPDLLDCHVRLGHDYGLVPVLPRSIRLAPDPRSYDAAVAALERAGLPVVDHIRGTLPVAAEAVEPGYRTLVEELPTGVTHFALHCTAPGDVEGLTPQHAPWRTNEYTLFASGAVAKWCAALGIEPVGYRDIQRLWLRDR
jgi:hypothetical protein